MRNAFLNKVTFLQMKLCENQFLCSFFVFVRFLVKLFKQIIFSYFYLRIRNAKEHSMSLLIETKITSNSNLPNILVFSS